MSSDAVSATDVYKAINGLRGEVREDQAYQWEEMKTLRQRDDEVAKCVQANKLKLEEHNGRLNTQNTEIKNIKISADKIDVHVDDQAIHFDKEKLDTTTLGYWAKKKALIILLTALSIIMATITGYITTILNSGGGP